MCFFGFLIIELILHETSVRYIPPFWKKQVGKTNEYHNADILMYQFLCSFQDYRSFFDKISDVNNKTSSNSN